MMLRSLATLGLILSPVIASAQDAPPAGAMPLSEILAKAEADLGGDLGHFSEIEWDDDGYYDVEYHNAEDREVSLRLDPMTGDAME
ncbi:PepSY domain-containing protein [Paracoccus sp. T5]|uniref:PepSY domain-containing protein n=1 Tax=Paracoccus sp. T5 TaxID=3402161 RepID=UPI003AE8271E